MRLLPSLALCALLALACGSPGDPAAAPGSANVPAAPPAAADASWAGTYTAEDPADERAPTYTLTLEGPMAARFDGTLEAAGMQLFYKLRVRAYAVDGGLQVVSLGTEDGGPPWAHGAFPEPDVNTPLFTLRREGGALRTTMGAWPGGPSALSFR